MTLSSLGQLMADLELQREELRAAVLACYDEHQVRLKHASSKSDLRQLHTEAVAGAVSAAQGALRADEPRFVSELAAGANLCVERIQPTLSIVRRGTYEARLFRWLTLHWSIPVSRGYGRRLRLLVRDQGNSDCVIGILGLADPVYALRGRDQHIGWSAEVRRTELRHMMDAFVLGAMPPYSDLIGIKLIALMLNSIELGKHFAEIYSGRNSRIAGVTSEATLAAITTTSALGRSSAYNRLRGPNGEIAAVRTGRTAGTGDFHIPPGLYEQLRRFGNARALATSRHRDWGGTGFRNRRDVLKRVLKDLGLNTDQIMTHGVERETYLFPRAANYIGFLRGSDNELISTEWTIAEATVWWLQRWALSRSARTETWRSFNPESWYLWGE